eukprot:TRINITY_DN67979_c2_g2_i2.p2 TRINITY_DN67979_c2_g2~~TRINITY_DN67979_c2_g2_i2.p2  ORF type:complete len:216 (+),score=27.30 TRINITY_DN67979_c2_g2_i2:35-649(+)
MRGVLQRVLSAKVTVGDVVVGSIGRGICVLVGIGTEDTIEDAKWLGNKLLNIRVWEQNEKNWAANVKAIEGEILLVSQFTLMHVLKGNKPDFHNAMSPQVCPGMWKLPSDPQQAAKLFDQFVEHVRSQYVDDKVKTGAFGEYMNVDIQNDGPVTLVIDTPPKVVKAKPEKKPQQTEQKSKTVADTAQAAQAEAEAVEHEAEGLK